MVTRGNLIFGVNPVLEKLKASPEDVLEILLADNSDRTPLRRINEQAAQLRVRTVVTGSKRLDQLVGGQRHQGVVARIEEYRYFNFEDLLKDVAQQPEVGPILILDGITDPRNFGALLRTTEGAGVRYVVIPKDRSAEVTPIVVKASAGAAHHVKISKVTNLRRALAALKKLDYWIVGLDAGGLESIFEKNFPPRLAVVLGSEGKGMRRLILEECDFLVSIPMTGKVESLNVSVAGAIFLYELLRQRRYVYENTGKGSDFR